MKRGPWLSRTLSIVQSPDTVSTILKRQRNYKSILWVAPVAVRRRPRAVARRDLQTLDSGDRSVRDFGRLWERRLSKHAIFFGKKTRKIDAGTPRTTSTRPNENAATLWGRQNKENEKVTLFTLTTWRKSGPVCLSRFLSLSLSRSQSARASSC